MADEVKKEEIKPSEDITKLKGTVDTLQQTNSQILAAIKEMQKIATTVPKKVEQKVENKSLKDVWFDDQDAAAQIIEDRAEKKFEAKLRASQEQIAKTQNVIRGLYKDFPELQDTDHPLTVKAIELFEKMTDEEKQSPLAYKIAVKDAADELEIKPKAKRKAASDEDDSYSLGGGNSRYSDGGSNRDKKKSNKLDPRTVEFGKLMGLKMDDPKVVENLQKHAGRGWNRYE